MGDVAITFLPDAGLDPHMRSRPAKGQLVSVHVADVEFRLLVHERPRSLLAPPASARTVLPTEVAQSLLRRPDVAVGVVLHHKHVPVGRERLGVFGRPLLRVRLERAPGGSARLYTRLRLRRCYGSGLRLDRHGGRPHRRSAHPGLRAAGPQRERSPLDFPPWVLHRLRPVCASCWLPRHAWLPSRVPLLPQWRHPAPDASRACWRSHWPGLFGETRFPVWAVHRAWTHILLAIPHAEPSVRLPAALHRGRGCFQVDLPLRPNGDSIPHPALHREALHGVAADAAGERDSGRR
mmetsp:Transcript_73638/g.204697  ORF Transcript_73638/g.204697 Transcript_73638/m.204697 type:complete len:293 (+) Transcript_73638:535-1413(+)